MPNLYIYNFRQISVNHCFFNRANQKIDLINVINTQIVINHLNLTNRSFLQMLILFNTRNYFRCLSVHFDYIQSSKLVQLFCSIMASFWFFPIGLFNNSIPTWLFLLLRLMKKTCFSFLANAKVLLRNYNFLLGCS